MDITSDITHVERAALQLGYKKFTASDLFNFNGVFLPAFIYEDGDVLRIFEISNDEFDRQPVFTIHITFEDEFSNIEIKWVGVRAFLAFITADHIIQIIRRQMLSFLIDNVGGEDLIEAIKDVDHIFVTPDVYLEHK